MGDLGSIPGLGRSPGEGNGNPLQDYCLENPMDRGAWSSSSFNAERLYFTCIILFSFKKGSFTAELKLEFPQNGMNCFEVFIEGFKDEIQCSITLFSLLL